MKFGLKVRWMALSALVVLGAIAVPTASAALPEFQKAGHPLAESVKFSGSGGAVSYETAAGDTGTCNATSITGETRGSTEVAGVILKFKSCHSAFNCHNASGEEMVTRELKGRLGYVKQSTKLVGLLLEASAQPFAECTWGTRHLELKGAVIARLTPINTLTTTFTLAYHKAAGRGNQELTKFEGEEVLHTLELYNPVTHAGEGYALESTLSPVTEKSIEIKA